MGLSPDFRNNFGHSSQCLATPNSTNMSVELYFFRSFWFTEPIGISFDTILAKVCVRRVRSSHDETHFFLLPHPTLHPHTQFSPKSTLTTRTVDAACGQQGARSRAKQVARLCQVYRRHCKVSEACNRCRTDHVDDTAEAVAVFGRTRNAAGVG